MDLDKYIDCIVKVVVKVNSTGNKVEEKELVGKLMSVELGLTGWDNSLFIKRGGYEVQGFKFTRDQVVSLEIYDDSPQETSTEDLKQVGIKNETKQANSVNHPAHYNSGKIEVIDYIEDQKLNFNLGNVVKYVSRAGKKDPAKELEDLNKAAWYLAREIERLQKEELERRQNESKEDN